MILYDELVTPVLANGSDICLICILHVIIERVHMRFPNSLFGVKTATQNIFVYGELGRIDFQTRR